MGIDPLMIRDWHRLSQSSVAAASIGLDAISIPLGSR